MQINGISDKVILRLPRYYRFLGELSNAGIKRISSGELAKKMGLNASQIRQDLNCFGGFGQQGYGYNTDILRKEIGAILGMDKSKKIILIGLGNLGNAVASHINFSDKGFTLIGIFDIKESLIGHEVRGVSVRSVENLDDFCRENKPVAAILCIPKDAVPNIAERLIQNGVTAFLNFSHYDIALNYEGVVVENVHIGDSLMRLSYDIKNLNN
ncbi:MAG: redox-sensing transcriptional repressor Rex [Clostridiales bacterium]|nr:redox-sensing transcriptional repressor Rex [Candidatus Equinaster intestinalis]